MEVHSHAHTHPVPDGHRGRKKWTHYFWEFLMLFLAVFCGFLAEYKLEHMIEHRWVKESMKEVVENLKYDTIRCRRNAETNLKVFSGIDSLRAELKKAIRGQINGNALYYFSLLYLGNVGQAVFNTSAITELKNSGYLRLVKNKKIILAMADYYERKVFAANEMMPNTVQLDALQTKLNEIFSLLHLDEYVNSFDQISPATYGNVFNYQDILIRSPSLQLLNKEPRDLEMLYTQISQFEIQLKKYNFWLYHNKEAAEKLIKEIQEEYHLN